MRTRVAPFAIVGAAVAIIALVVLAILQPWASDDAGDDTDGATPDGPQAPTTPMPPVLDETTHVLSDAGEGAPVLVEFLDFECPTCGAIFPTMEELRATYGDEVTFAVRYLPIASHVNAIPAALAAEAAAQQGEFEAMYQALFSHQHEWAGLSGSQAELFRELAAGIGLDMQAYDAAIDDPATLERIELDAQAAQALGVQSTPTIFIDDEQLQLQTIDDIEAGIQRALDG